MGAEIARKTRLGSAFGPFPGFRAPRACAAIIYVYIGPKRVFFPGSAFGINGFFRIGSFRILRFRCRLILSPPRILLILLIEALFPILLLPPPPARPEPHSYSQSRPNPESHSSHISNPNATGLFPILFLALPLAIHQIRRGPEQTSCAEHFLGRRFSGRKTS